jgi:hypothetical protein
VTTPASGRSAPEMAAPAASGTAARSPTSYFLAPPRVVARTTTSWPT